MSSRDAKMTRAKTPTLKEKVEVYEQLLHDLYFHSSVTMDHDKVMDCLNRIATWSYAHRGGNGELSQQQVRTAVNQAFWNVKK